MNKAEYVLEDFSVKRKYKIKDTGVMILFKVFWNSTLSKPKYKRENSFPTFPWLMIGEPVTLLSKGDTYNYIGVSTILDQKLYQKRRVVFCNN